MDTERRPVSERWRSWVSQRQGRDDGSALPILIPIPQFDYITHWSPHFQYIYVETPKVACTTIKRVLQIAELNGVRERLGPNVHDRALSPLLSPAHNRAAFSEAMASPAFFRFCFVRNPYTRVLSAYLDKLLTNAWERNLRGPPLGFPQGYIPGFEEFLEAVRRQPAEERDIHWTTQSRLLNPVGLGYDFIGRFETFEPDFARICRHLQIELHPADLGFGKIHATGANRRTTEYLNGKSTALIQSIYEDDFLTFGYGWSPDAGLCCGSTG